jgi:tetratricopeptide (TPR) repeat protein
MSEDVMLNKAIEAIRHGQRTRSRDLLTRLLRADPNNPTYWIWMSSVVETGREQIYCLKNALKLDPKNTAARQGLRLLGAIPPRGEVKPAPPKRRKWQVEQLEVRELNALGRVFSNPFVRLSVFSLSTLVVFLLLGFGLYFQGTRGKPVAAFIPTRTAGPSPTYTLTPTAINETPSTPTTQPHFNGVPPLWAKLSSTYTPTPIYVNTPHFSNEAFQLAQQALSKGDITTALSNIRQAEQVDPYSPDIPFFIGEIYRQQGDFRQALEAYQKSVSLDPGFAPAYLGLARTNLILNPKANVLNDLRHAMDADPNWSEASLELAGYLIDHGETEQAMEILSRAESFASDSPLFYIRRAQANLALGNVNGAFKDAQEANRLDQTQLETYRLLAYTAAVSEDYHTAMESVQVYLTYEKNDPIAWAIQGRAYYGEGDYEKALEALEKALQLDKKLAEARLYHGLTLLELGQGQDAINDIYLAQQTNPRSFSMNLYLGRAMLAAGRLGDALGQINRAHDLAQNDKELAEAFYWRAQVYEAIGNLFNARRDWNRLLDLPPGSAPQGWLDTAEAHLAPTSTPAPTASPTPTFTRTPTLTRTPKEPSTLRSTQTTAPTKSSRPSTAI